MLGKPFVIGSNPIFHPLLEGSSSMVEQRNLLYLVNIKVLTAIKTVRLKKNF